MADSAPELSLAVGDRVVYPNQGVCRVFNVDTHEVAGQKLTFVSMRREEDGAVVMVPTTKVQSIGLRKLASHDQVAKLFTFLSSDSDKADLDWKQRARTNVDRMTQGGIHGLAEVVKGLQVLSELRPLPTKERELYDNARHLLVSEIAASLSISECDAEDAIDFVLSPPGKERPKRTAEEFKQPSADDEGLALGADLLALGGDLELPSDEEPEAAEAEASEEEAAAEPEAEEQEAPDEGRARRPKKAAEAKRAATANGHPGAKRERAKLKVKAPEANKSKAEPKARGAKLPAAKPDIKSKRKASAPRPAKAPARKKK
jgi:RNA polymerase-interacting CarD/CdnL/TRCF family regulator